MTTSSNSLGEIIDAAQKFEEASRAATAMLDSAGRRLLQKAGWTEHGAGLWSPVANKEFSTTEPDAVRRVLQGLGNLGVFRSSVNFVLVQQAV